LQQRLPWANTPTAGNSMFAVVAGVSGSLSADNDFKNMQQLPATKK